MGCPAARYGRPRRPCQGGRGGSPAHFRETHLLKSTRRPTRARGAGRARRDRSSPGAPAAAASEAVPGWRGGPGGRVNERKRLLTSRDAADRQSRQIVKAGGARRGAEAAGNLGRSGGGGGGGVVGLPFGKNLYSDLTTSQQQWPLPRSSPARAAPRLQGPGARPEGDRGRRPGAWQRGGGLLGRRGAKAARRAEQGVCQHRCKWPRVPA